VSACDDHPFDVATGTCAACRRTFCATCLVYPHGPQKHPFCIPCAVTAAGVRRTAARAPVTGRALPRLQGSRTGTVARVVLGVVLAGGTGLAGLNIVNALG